MTRKNRTGSIERGDPHWIEWLTGLVSTLLVLAMIGWIAREAWQEAGGPPDLTLTVTATDRTNDGTHRFRFDIANRSTSTAAGVTVRGELRRGDQVVEQSDVTFDYVPAKSVTHGALMFRGDPAGREAVLTVAGYTEP